MAVASALVRALRGRRGPVAAAMALGRRGLGGAYPSRGPLVMRRTFASGNGTGTGGIGAVCADCSRDIVSLRAKMLQEIHELSVHCAKLGHDNVDLRKIIVMNQLKAHGRLSKLTFETLAFFMAGVVGSFALFMAPFVRESWRAKRKERTLAEAMSPTESPKEEEGGGALGKAKSPKEEEEEGGAALVKAKSPKEEEGGGALVKAKSPKEEEEEGGAALVKAKSSKEEEGGGALVKAKSPKEEEGGGALVKAKSPKEEEGGGGFAV